MSQVALGFGWFASRHPVRPLLAFSLLCGFLVGCDAKPDATAEATAGKHVASNDQKRERAEFDRLLASWRGVVGQLAQLDVQYRILGSRNDPGIRKRFQELLSEGRELEPQLIEAAIVAYTKRPEDNKDLVDFLLSVTALELGKEEYETAAKVVQRLIDGGVQSQLVFEMAIPAVFKANEFDLAEKYLALEKKLGFHGGMQGLLQNAGNLDYFKNAWARETQLREAERMADDLPRVKLRTNKGEIELELFENEAPNTVANFIWLVEKGFYDGLTFHRVVGGEIAQAGCPKGDGSGGPGYSIACECFRPNRRCHFRGSLSMATAGPNTGGSQFFLAMVPAAGLDGRHTVFGRVVRGMDVLSKLQRRTPRDAQEVAINPNANVIVPPADRILEATVLRKRPHPYKPQTLPEAPSIPTEPPTPLE